MASKFLSPAYEVMLSAASPGINFLRGIAGYQDPIGTPAMQDRMLELEAQKGPSGSIGYEDYGLPVSSEGGRFTGGLPSLLLSNPIDFGLAGSVGRYGYSPEGRTGLKYDFTPDEETGSTGNAILDFINRGGIKNYISESKGLPFALPDLSLGAPTFNFNRNKTTQPNSIDPTQNYYQPMAMRKDLGMDTSYGVANEPDVEQDQEYIDQVKKSQGGGIGGLFKFLLGLAAPGAGFLMNLPGRGLEGIRSLNQRIQGSDFGQSRTLAEYAMKRRERKQAERAQEAMPEVYKSAKEQGFTNDRGGFSTNRADRAGTSVGSGQFSPSTSRGRSGY